VQLEAPVSALVWVPAGQAEHAATPVGEYVPAAHTEGIPAALVQSYPAGQSLQAAAPAEDA
jgi:hypothetical protein